MRRHEGGTTHFSLFSGIGGIDLAAEWAGFETVGQCEFADYPTKVLEKHWPDVPRWRDIRDVTADSFRERTGLHTVDLVSGGFPCQPFSVAGKQKGKGDDRYLWPEMLRVIRELKPRWVLGENVPGILRITADDVCKDLECEGYDVGIFDFEAAAVGAPHRRERILFVGNTKCCGLSREPWRWAGKEFAVRYPEMEKGIMANSNNERQQTSVFTRNTGEQNAETQHDSPPFEGHGNERIRTWWSIEPDVGRVAHGISNRVDRLKCLGNAVVPQQVYPILKAIADIENGYLK